MVGERTSVDGNRIICPNCQSEQAQSAECIRCGIIFSKYRAKAEKESVAPPAEPAEDPVGTPHDIPASVSEDSISEDGAGTTDTKWAFQRVLPEKVEHLFTNILVRRNPYVRYLLNGLDIIVQAVLLLLTTFCLCLFLLFMMKIAWKTFVYSPVGEKFLQLQIVSVESLTDVFSRSLPHFSLQVTLEAFTICLIAGAFCRITHVARYLYHPQGMFGRFVFLALPLSALAGVHFQRTFGFTEFGLSCLMALIPTVCLFSGCFKFAEELLPETGSVLHTVKEAIARRIATHPAIGRSAPGDSLHHQK